jgi:hypothetical protein
LNRVWISREPATCDRYCAVWIELGDGRLVYVLDNGAWGFSNDAYEAAGPEDNTLTDELEIDELDAWERIA